MDYNQAQLEEIDEYLGVFRDDWKCQIDHEDGSTAPFSSLALRYAYNYPIGDYFGFSTDDTV